MAEVAKPVEVPATEAPVVAPVETKPAEETPAAPVEAAAPVEEAKPAEEKPAEEAAATEEAKPEEKKDEEVKPVESGFLGHKAQGASFPKNLIPSKEFFFFGTDAFEPKSLSAYQKSAKSAEVAQANIAWAAETAKGLLFIGDKKTPTGIINLSDASEPEIEGTNKFTLTSKGNKHSFKAANAAERDNWVSQLKLKIAEAKELATTVIETETYKATLESFKPKKEEPKPAAEVAPVTEEATKIEETPAPAVEEPAQEETVKTEAAKTEEPKRRSASRKRASFFGFGKKEEKKEEVKAEETKAEETPAVEPAVEAEAPKPVEETPAPVVAEETPAVVVPTEEEKKEEATSPAETPKASKRNSFFGGVFSKKEKKVSDAKPAEETPVAKEGETAPTEESAPVIPPVETSTPLAVEVPATTPAATETEVLPAANGDAKKDTKEKRKSSLPFLNKKATSPVEGESSKGSAFSKLRATIKGKSAPKAEKPAEDAPATTEEAAKEDAVKTEEATKEEPKPAEEVAVEEPKPAAAAVETKPETVATTTPAVTAAA